VTTPAVRTPEERFEGLPGFAFRPRYREALGLRLAHLDEGAGPPVLFLHGEPTWSFLWRQVLPPVLDAGFRCVVPDLPGFGQSDKPVDSRWYSFDRHTEAVASLLADLDLRDATLVAHDWGGPIGLRLAVEQPRRFARLVLMDTGVFTGQQRMSDAWTRFRDYVARTEDLPVGWLVRRGCLHDPGDEVAAAYDAPFSEPAAKAGAKAFPALIPLTPDAPGAEAGRRTLAGLRERPRPTLILWGEADNALPPVLADLLTAAGSDRVVSVDLHAGQIQGYFDFPFDHLTALPVLSGYLQNELGLHGDDLVIVSPDAGRIKTAERLREYLHADLAFLYKRRSRKEAHKIEEMAVVGEVNGRPCILVDDMIDTASTVSKGATLLAQQGAGPIYAAATHPVLSGKAVQNLEEAPITEVVVTNTMPIPEEKRFGKLKVLSIAPLIADALRAVFEESSVSEIFHGENQ